MLNSDEEDLIANPILRRKKKCCRFNPNIILVILLITQLVTLGIVIGVTYKVHKLDIELINYDSTEIANILSNNGTEKIINVLENIDLNDYVTYVDKVRHIIDDACYYIFNCYDNSSGLKLKPEAAKLLLTLFDHHQDQVPVEDNQSTLPGVSRQR